MEAQIREDYREVLAWLRGGDRTPDTRMEDMFISVIASMVQERMKTTEEMEREKRAAERKERRNRHVNVPSIRAIMQDMYARGEIRTDPSQIYSPVVTTPREVMTEPVQQHPAEWEPLDSYSVGKVIRYLGQVNCHPVNMSQIQVIMYVSYGLWLASKGERLMVEHPQMWQFGPVFPRAYGKLRKDSGDGREEYQKLQAHHPEVLDFIRDRFHRFAWMTATAANAPHVAEGSPWAMTRRQHPDKWGAVMEDGPIADWFRERINRGKG